MKVIKELDQSLLLNHFGIKDKYYLVVTILIFFDLNNPSEPLKESELWPFVRDRLGQDTIFEQGMPKPKAEVLVHGSCFAPDEVPVRGARVSFRVGSIHKGLDVFGRRFWRKRGGVYETVTDPEPFTVMDINYNNAFGGEGFAKNPVGVGYIPDNAPSGHDLWPLPCVEDPNHLIASPHDRPEPAGFCPYDLMWPQRHDKLGTYDERWLRERWPYYPEDMNYSFFNTAPDDQQREEYFQGDESLEIENMHRSLPGIRSGLPGLRMRCFLTQLSPGDPDRKNAQFRENTTRLDTVWLFPADLRGVAVYRGVAETVDDEASDVLRIFLASERLKEEPGSIDDYLEEEKKRLDKKVSVDLSKLDEAKEQIAQAKEKVKAIPELVKAATDRALGKAPRPPAKASEAVMGEAMERLRAGADRLSRTEARLTGLKAKFGHLVKIDVSGIGKAKEALAGAAEKMRAASEKIDQAKADIAGRQEEVRGALKDLPPDVLKDAGIDPAALFFDPKPEKMWHDSGMKFLVACRDNLLRDRELQNKLSAAGLTRKTIKSAWLGVNPEEGTAPRPAWGLPVDGDGGAGEVLKLPAGLVIPRFSGAGLKRLLVRPGNPADSSRDELVEGSKDAPLVLGAAEGKCFLRVGDDLEAFLAHQEAGDLCAVAALADAGQAPDDETGELIASAKAFLVASPADPDDRNREDLEAFRETYPNAFLLSLPAGKNLIEAHGAGVDLRQWILEALPPEALPVSDDETEPAEERAEEARPNAADLAKGIKQDLDGVVGPKLAQLMDRKKTLTDQVKAKLEDLGRDPEQALSPEAGSLPQKPFDAAGLLAGFAGARARLQSAGVLTPEMEQKIAQAEKKAQGIADRAAARHEAGLGKIEAAREKAKNPIPDQVKARMKAAGIDPDDREPMTREAVMERYEQGRSLAGKNLSGLDLSGLDLPGIDLRRANLKKTVFTGSNLKDADLTGAIGSEADCSQAILTGARMENGVFNQAGFQEADLSRAGMGRALLKEADLTSAVLTGAVLDGALLEKATMIKADLREASAEKGYFLGADVSEANFSGADLTKAAFLNAVMDNADFTGAKAHQTTVWGGGGDKVVFADAELHNFRVGGNAKITGADFKGAKIHRACLREADLPGADFRTGTIQGSLIEKCDLKGANFNRVAAHKTRIHKCDLTGADLAGVNLFQGSLRKSTLVDVDLSRANLYGVEVYQAVTGNTRFDKANLKMTRLAEYQDVVE